MSSRNVIPSGTPRGISTYQQRNLAVEMLREYAQHDAWWFYLVLLVMCTGASPSTTAPTTAPIEEPFSYKLNTSIERAVYFLLQRQDKSGAWVGREMSERAMGRTGLVGLALLAAGESPTSPAISKALEYLKHQKQERTYSVALRAAFYSQLPETLRREQLRSDVRWLINAAGKRGDSAGMYTYGPFAERNPWLGDYSNSQYGVLGVWYAALAGLEVPSSYWKSVEDAWRRGQGDDGGWGYTPGSGRSYASMTAAGAATLFVTNDYLHAPQERDLRKRIANEPLDRAVGWLGKYFAVDQNSGRDGPLVEPNDRDELIGALIDRPRGSWIFYMLFGYERVGEASGLTRFGSRKWFDEGARYLMRLQEDDGRWSGDFDAEVDTAYALLFLARGRAPVALQKLQWQGRWNNRSRDAATLVHWLSRQMERHANWQIVGLDASPVELREAPILYIAGNESFVPDNAGLQKIKQYIDQGGLLLAVNEGEKSEFADSIEKLAATMYPEYPLRDLPGDHLIFNENFAIGDGGLRLRGVSNGVRELIILVPRDDLSWKWQAGAGTEVVTKAPAFAPAANLWLYVTDKSNPRFKGEDWWIDSLPRVTDRARMDIARLQYSGNFNPEPAGWTRLANLLHNEDRIAIKTYNVDAGLHRFTPQDYAIAHLTGTGPIELSSQQEEGLKKFLDDGGFLIFDAAGGSVSANVSAEALMNKLYPGATIARLPENHEIFSDKFGGGTIRNVTFRRFTATREPNSSRARLSGVTVNKRLVAILSAADLSAGIVGYSKDGIAGYSPQSATDLMRNIILWRQSQVSR